MAYQPEEDRSSRQEPCLKTPEAKSGGRNMSNYPNLLAINPKPYNGDPCNKECSTSTSGAGELPYSYSLPEGFVMERPAPEWRWEMRRVRKRCPAMGCAGRERCVL